ncbi:MAG: pyruvate kinase [Firmicutes bacterium]|nr:pyruvate kinase [Bacillota bacterium]
MRKTKIICTLGPATDDMKIMEQLVESGMNVARINFSHGTHEEQGKRMQMVRDVRRKYNKHVAILLDTKGPEIRIGNFENGRIELKAGDEFYLCCEDILGNQNSVSVTYKELYKDIEPGTRILIDDGLIEMFVESIEGKRIKCRVQNSGVILNHKGVNIPGVHANLPYMSEKDISDILFGIENDIDFIAASFVRCADDIRKIRHLLLKNGGNDINIIAKIENHEGVENIDEIIRESDGIMIARGDMGVELPGEEVPVVQKMIIKKVYEAGKQVITATQMLDSMMQHPRPTRAETADVANAIYDGTSAIMLSGETAAGKFPVESLKTMVRIADRTEHDIDYRKRFFNHDRRANPDVTDAICHATCTTAHDLNASAIITVSKSGRTARMISRYRPYCDIIGCTIKEKVSRQLNMSWGVTPILLEEKNDVFELFDHAIDSAKHENLLKAGDIAVITSGVPMGMSGTTNMIKVQVVE